MCESIFLPSVFRCTKQHYFAEGSKTSPTIPFGMGSIKMKKGMEY